MEYEELIRENLKAIDEDFDELKPFMQKRLVEVETVIQNRELSTSLEGKNSEIERLQKRISELSEENHKLKSEISTKTRKIFS